MDKQSVSETARRIALLRRLLTVVVALLSYIGGCAAYAAASKAWSGEVPPFTLSFLFWTFTAYVTMGAPFFWLLCTVIKRRFGRNKKAVFVSILVCGLYFVVPTMLTYIMLLIPFPELLVAPIAIRFYILFGSSGILFGMGYGIVQRFAGAKSARTIQ
ncbi:hypothetical protein [Paenibacillus tarimensis]|uniref:hypothetical protein n=1 Tax=Paenibacillus tarimensis TaxID=416012 RepID=UPI001F2CD782|nr:hypothetical protein [Paenibacillus tarimensis]MCF2944774.1 hypothetical protein [Paenibacillus tarimensis]